jgi:hypothetical protein
MLRVRASSRQSIRLAALVVVIGLGRLVGDAQRAEPPDAAHLAPKLTTVLQEIAGVVSQDRAPTAAAATPLDVNALPKSARDAIRIGRLHLSDAGEIQVVLLTTGVTDERLQQLTTGGATIEIAEAASGRVQARAPAARLLSLAALDFVTFVTLPSYAIRHEGAALTEGDAIVRTDRVRSALAVDGTGVRLGVLSDGLKGVFGSGCTTCGSAPGGPIATHDLPSAVGIRNASGLLTQSSGGIVGRSFQANGDLEGLPSGSCGFAGAGAEGTALLEIVHDLAPGARLAFANANTELEFNQAVTYLASTNDVVVDDIGFFGLPADGTSSVSTNTANALNNPSNPIRSYITSVGNGATSHYLGTYTNSGLDGTTVTGITTPGHLHLFQATADTSDVLGLGPQPHDVIVLPHGGEVAVFLTWDERFGTSSSNYDLYLIEQSTNRVVAKSTDTQSGSQNPVEVLDFVNSGNTGFFQIAIQNVRDQAPPRQLNLYAFEPECATDGPRPLVANRHERHNFNTPGHSITAQSDAGGSPASVISVGAICSASAAAQGVFAGSAADESCNDRTHGTIEFFSSRGPTLDGRIKPDVSAVDGVTVTGAGGFSLPFFGSSAAAPHLAGEAALLLQSAPCFIGGGPGAIDVAAARTSLRKLLVQNAVASESEPPDNTFGYGLADALAAADKTLPVFQGPSSLTVSGNAPGGANIGPATLGFVDSNGCQLTRLNWTGGCGSSPGSALACPFGTSTVTAGASNNGLSFSTPLAFTITVTNFAIAAMPSSATVRSGQGGTYAVTVSALGGPFATAIVLGCSNLPPGATCTFTPSTITPGAASAQSTLTIATTAQAATADGSWPGAPTAVVLIVLAGCCAAIAGHSRLARPIRLPAYTGIALLCVACGGSTTPLPGSSAATLSPPSVTFGATAVHATSAPQTVTLTNGGAAALTLTGITAGGDFAQTNACGSSLAAGASCTIQVTFTPTAAGARSGALVVADNAAGSPQSVALAGTGNQVATQSGTYQLNITGTAGALVQTAPVSLTVQ